MKKLIKSDIGITLLLMSFSVISLITIWGCNTSTKPDETGGISGMVVLQAPTSSYSKASADYSGVMVAVYNEATLDTMMLRINQSHPGIGIVENQETRFDHRLQSPIATTITGVNGAFSFDGITPGEYNIAFLKEGWSLKYLYSISVSAGTTKNVGENIITAAVTYNSTVLTPVTFRGDTSYLITNTVNFMAPITIEKGARIFVKKNESLRFNNLVSITSGKSIEDYWKVDTDIGMYSITSSVISSSDYFADVTVNSPANSLSFGLIKNVYDGLKINTDDVMLTDIHVYNFVRGMSFIKSGTCEKVSLRNGSLRGMHFFSNQGAASVRRSIVSRVDEGFLLAATGGFVVEDSYFIDNGTSIFAQDCNGTVQHCSFERNWYDVRVLNANPAVQYNNFYSNKYISIYPRRLATIVNNNFFSTDYMFISIRMEQGPNYSIVDSNLFATNNYWAVIEPEDYLLDSGDNHLFPGQECLYDIICLPRKTNKIATAGVRY